MGEVTRRAFAMAAEVAAGKKEIPENPLDEIQRNLPKSEFPPTQRSYPPFNPKRPDTTNNIAGTIISRLAHGKLPSPCEIAIVHDLLRPEQVYAALHTPPIISDYVDTLIRAVRPIELSDKQLLKVAGTTQVAPTDRQFTFMTHDEVKKALELTDANGKTYISRLLKQRMPNKKVYSELTKSMRASAIILHHLERLTRRTGIKLNLRMPNAIRQQNIKIVAEEAEKTRIQAFTIDLGKLSRSASL